MTGKEKIGLRLLMPNPRFLCKGCMLTVVSSLLVVVDLL